MTERDRTLEGDHGADEPDHQQHAVDVRQPVGETGKGQAEGHQSGVEPGEQAEAGG